MCDIDADDLPVDDSPVNPCQVSPPTPPPVAVEQSGGPADAAVPPAPHLPAPPVHFTFTHLSPSTSAPVELPQHKLQSKDSYRSKKRSREYRRAKRAAAARTSSRTDALGDGPVVKSIAWKRRAAALALKLCVGAEDDVLAAAAIDQAATYTEDAAPIETDFSLDMKDVPVAKADRKSTRLNSSHSGESRMPSSA